MEKGQIEEKGERKRKGTMGKEIQTKQREQERKEQCQEVSQQGEGTGTRVCSLYRPRQWATLSHSPIEIHNQGQGKAERGEGKGS